MDGYQSFSGENDVNKLIVEVFRLNGALLKFGDQLVADLGLTSSKWQVLGTLNNSGGPLSMPGIALNMGLSRQGVRTVLKPLLDAGMAELVPNPLHKRSPHVRITVKGAKAYARAMRRHAPFAEALRAKLSAKDLQVSLKVMKTLLEAVNERVSDEKGATDQ